MQASQAAASKSNPFNCPSCRALVRETRPNATVTTLLEMYLQANPGRARTGEEKEEIKKTYTQGEDILVKVKRKRGTNDEEEDRRIVEEVREMSLREVGVSNNGSHERRDRHGTGETATAAWVNDARQRRRHESDHGSGPEAAGPSASRDPAVQARRIEHQSSLRSLMSSSDVDSSEMQEEILRQIRDEGILDGIDLDNLDVSQEDELSERIAEAYRRRHRLRARQQENASDRPQTPDSRGQGSDAPEQRHHRRPARSPNPPESSTHSSHPPLSRPHLLEAYPTGQGHRRRTSSEHRRQTSPTPPSNSSRTSSNTQRQAARSATDLSNTARTVPNHRERPLDVSGHNRRTSDTDRLRFRGEVRDSTPRTSQDSRSPRTRPRAISSTQANGANVPSPQPSPNRAARPDLTVTHQASRNDRPSTASRTLSQPSTSAPAQLPSYPEPSVSCDRCGKRNLEYELHENCPECNDGKYHLCLRCYRLGRGCLHWFGFGHLAMQRYRQQEPVSGYPPNHPLPHRLTGHRYLPPPPETRHIAVSGSSVSTSSDPGSRLQAGPFCSNCSNFAPDCYWKCDECNAGEWGYCNACVNQGRCCTHALLPVRYLDSINPQSTSPSSQAQHSSITPLLQPPKSASDNQFIDQLTGQRYIPLTFSTKCDICTYPIPPSNTRFHCPKCNEGDYDICSPCYNKLVNAGQISIENGAKGWRRCPSGHRMIIVGFQDSGLGQRRVVVEDLVGGHALRDEAEGDSSLEWKWQEDGQPQVRRISKTFPGRPNEVRDSPLADGVAAPPLLKIYPPNGGNGMRVLALWSWWPADDVSDELAFPKGAEIRECEDVNGEWFWGTYCSKMGLFPSNYGRVLEIIRM